MSIWRRFKAFLRYAYSNPDPTSGTVPDDWTPKNSAKVNAAMVKVFDELRALSDEEFQRRLDLHKNSGLGEMIMYAKNPDYFKEERK